MIIKSLWEPWRGAQCRGVAEARHVPRAFSNSSRGRGRKGDLDVPLRIPSPATRLPSICSTMAVGYFDFSPEGGKTRYKAGPYHWDEKGMKQHEAMGFTEGWGIVAEQFAAIAEEIAGRR